MKKQEESLTLSENKENMKHIGESHLDIGLRRRKIR